MQKYKQVKLEKTQIAGMCAANNIAVSRIPYRLQEISKLCLATPLAIIK